MDWEGQHWVGYLFSFLLIILCSYIAWRKYKRWADTKEKFIAYKVIKPPSKLVSEGEGAKRKRVCAVVGGTWFIGLQVVNELVERGDYYVYVLRHTVCPERTNPNADCLIQVDLRDIDGLIKAFQGVDSVISAAAYIPNVFMKADEIRHINKTGFENILQAVKEAGVKHLVHLSTIPIVPRIKDPVMRAYRAVHTEFQTTVTDTNGKDGLNTCVIGPANIVGRDDLFFKKIISGKMRIVPMSDNMPVSFMPLEYLARAVVNAEMKLAAGDEQIAGKFFPLQGELMSWKTFFQLPTWPHKLKALPKWIMLLVKINTFFADFFGWAPFGPYVSAGLFEIVEITQSDKVDPGQVTEAYNLLGVGPPAPPMKEYIAELVEWYKASQEDQKEK